jgi:hypothetical protein
LLNEAAGTCDSPAYGREISSFVTDIMAILVAPIYSSYIADVVT